MIPRLALAGTYRHQKAIMAGKTVLFMHCGNDDPEVWRQRLGWKGAKPVLNMP